ncbi:MAG: hypothetical protein ACLPQ6_03340 [Steroidobacteraceae bacterium]
MRYAEAGGAPDALLRETVPALLELLLDGLAVRRLEALQDGARTRRLVDQLKAGGQHAVAVTAAVRLGVHRSTVYRRLSRARATKCR